MKGFIEVTDRNNRKVCVGIRYIGKINWSEEQKETHIYTEICCIQVKETYEEIKQKIEEAQEQK